MHRLVLFSLSFWGLALAVHVEASANAFGMADVERLAADLASRPYVAPPLVSEPFLNLTYDLYRMIAPRRENALWMTEPFPTAVQFFSAGFFFKNPVEIYTVENGAAQLVEYDQKWFDFRHQTASLADVPGNGFSGFRFLTRFPGADEKWEYFVFQGASYFRGIGQGQTYGSSARGLAVDIGLPKPEEFPRFSKFWIEKPTAHDGSQPDRCWALADSYGIVGAFEFQVRPGTETTVDVTGAIWPRHQLEKIALAPITSMWAWDSKLRAAEDFRPEVHDADGLLIRDGDGNWTWRGLNRPEHPHVEQFHLGRVTGFGLMQRDREFSHYADQEALYHNRPSVWVETKGDFPWSTGHVELLEFRGKDETDDNIGAYFVLDQNRLPPEQPIRFQYTVTFTAAMPPGLDVAQVKDAAIDRVARTGAVWFRLPPGMSSDNLTPQARSERGVCKDIQHKIADDGTLNVTFAYEPPQGGEDRLEIWLTPTGSAEKSSEVWSHRWIP